MADLIDKAEALEPCPFCGGKARKWQDPSHSAAWFIGCDDGDRDCFGSIHWAETETEAIAAWNRRAALAPTEPPEEIGILRARVEDQATEIARLTRIIQMQPPARTTDAAQARQAALQAERDAPDYRLAPDLQRIADRAKTAPHWDTENDRLAVPDRKPVWPDFIAPPKYDNPDPRWVDPALPDFRLIWKIARECGYAVGLHGSMKRDCDLIAVPWTDEAVLAFDLIYRLCEALHAQVLGPVAGKPHGRLGWILQVDGYVKVIDISVVPRSQDRATPALKRIGTGLYETAFTPSAIRDAALREAAEVCAGIRQRIANGPMPEGARFDYEQAILALIGEVRT